MYTGSTIGQSAFLESVGDAVDDYSMSYGKILSAIKEDKTITTLMLYKNFIKIYNYLINIYFLLYTGH